MKPNLDIESLQTFWADQAENITWSKKWDKVLDWQEPFAKWFVGGMLNASQACVDVHVQGDKKDKVAIFWESENGDQRAVTYGELFKMVNRYASVLHNLGVKKGDIVILYLPMTPEAAAMMLAVARLGATHSVVFSGFSSQALQNRIDDAQVKFVVTADVGFRRGKYIPLKNIVDEAVELTPSIEKVLVIKRSDEPISMRDGRDVYLHDVLKCAQDFVEPVQVESSHPLYVLYTSGTTGTPKGLIHGTGGYLTYVYSTFKSVFDPHEKTVYWCNADIGWVTGHSYVVYGPLLHGVSMVMHEGTPDYPDKGVWWKLVEKYNVSVFYTSPTALRMCKKFGDEWPYQYDLSSLEILGTVGEVINPEVWDWYYRVIGKGNCPIVDTWWQTETGGFMISPAPGLDSVTLKPGSATLPLPGVDADVVDENGNSVPAETKGYLVIKKPWPGMTIGILNDPERFKEVYWSKFPGCYYPGDYALKDNDGFFWLLGRADEVVNIAGHRIGTAEIESAAVLLDEIVEAAAIGVHDDIRGETIVVFATPQSGVTQDDALKTKIKISIRDQIGKFVIPREIYFIDKLPKTRSGKIMRRLLKAILDGQSLGDISTLEDVSSVDDIRSTCEKVQAVVQL